MSKHILTIYKLPARTFAIRQREIADDTLHVTATVKKKGAACPGCGQVTRSHHDTGKGTSRIRYDLWHGHVVHLPLRKRRFSCRNPDCERGVFTGAVPVCSGRYRRGAGPFESRCLALPSERAFAAAAEGTGTPRPFLVRPPARSVPARFTAGRPVDRERGLAGRESVALGVDEHSQGKGRMVMTVTNLAAGRPVAIPPDARGATLGRFLRRTPGEHKKRVALTATDLTNRHRRALSARLPRARASADCLHVRGSRTGSSPRPRAA